MSEMRPGAETRRFGRTASLLSAGVAASGVLTYLFFSLASHNLDATQYGEIVVLWSAVFVTISVAYRPVEQLLSRTLADRIARGEDTAPAIRTAARIQAFGRARPRRGDAPRSRCARRRAPVGIGHSLLGSLRRRHGIRSVVLRAWLSGRDAAVLHPGVPARLRIRRPGALRARARARHRRRTDGGSAWSRGGPDGQPGRRPCPGPALGTRRAVTTTATRDRSRWRRAADLPARCW